MGEEAEAVLASTNATADDRETYATVVYYKNNKLKIMHTYTHKTKIIINC